MRRLSILLLALALTVSFGQAQYFPGRSLDLRGGNSKNEWYMQQLKALEEPSLFARSKTPASEAYRFLWLRSFNAPIAIRLEPQSDGTSVLTTKIASGRGGYRPGSLVQNTSRLLTREQTQAFLSKLNRLNFWKLPNPVNDQRGTDGSQWILEGVKGGQYHVADRWSPQGGPVRELGVMLVFELAKMSIPQNEIY